MRCMSKGWCKFRSSINVDVRIFLVFWRFLFISIVTVSPSNHKTVAWVTWLPCEIRLCDGSELNGKSLSLEFPFWLYKENFRIMFNRPTGRGHSLGRIMAPPWPTPRECLYKLRGDNVLCAYLTLLAYLNSLLIWTYLLTLCKICNLNEVQ
jgi:hypothetical protein